MRHYRPTFGRIWHQHYSILFTRNSRRIEVRLETRPGDPLRWTKFSSDLAVES